MLKNNRTLKSILMILATMMTGSLLHANPHTSLNAQCEAVRPFDYHTWVYVGTPLTPNDMNGEKGAPFPEFHNVYIDPVSYGAYLQTAEFPDGTILIKELVSTSPNKAAASGQGYFQDKFVGLEAAVKSKRCFPDSTGNWAYFSFGKYTKEMPTLARSATAMPTEACAACHTALAEDDMVFTQYYPILRLARDGRLATIKTENHFGSMMK